MMWKEVVVAKRKVLSRNLPTRTEENMTNLSHDGVFLDRGLSPGPSEYEAGTMNAWKQRSLKRISLRQHKFYATYQNIS
jgi:hypothetical protein